MLLKVNMLLVLAGHNHLFHLPVSDIWLQKWLANMAQYIITSYNIITTINYPTGPMIFVLVIHFKQNHHHQQPLRNMLDKTRPLSIQQHPRPSNNHPTTINAIQTLDGVIHHQQPLTSSKITIQQF